MSAQGATLGRGIVHLPIWPVAALVAAIAAVTVGLTLIDRARPETSEPFALSGQAANSTSALRESGIVVPAIQPGIVFESTTAVRELGLTLPVSVGISHVTPRPTSVGYAGFENPAAYAVPWDSIGGPNEALHRQYSPPREGAAPTAGSDPITVNGKACMQCR